MFFLLVFISDYCVYSTCLRVRDGFYTVFFWGGASELGFCWFVADICDDFAIFVFYMDV